jgi:hypothetical protein
MGQIIVTGLLIALVFAFPWVLIPIIGWYALVTILALISLASHWIDNTRPPQSSLRHSEIKTTYDFEVSGRSVDGRLKPITKNVDVEEKTEPVLDLEVLKEAIGTVAEVSDNNFSVLESKIIPKVGGANTMPDKPIVILGGGMVGKVGRMVGRIFKMHFGPLTASEIRDQKFRGRHKVVHRESGNNFPEQNVLSKSVSKLPAKSTLDLEVVESAPEMSSPKESGIGKTVQLVLAKPVSKFPPKSIPELEVVNATHERSNPKERDIGNKWVYDEKNRILKNKITGDIYSAGQFERNGVFPITGFFVPKATEQWINDWDVDFIK